MTSSSLSATAGRAARTGRVERGSRFEGQGRWWRFALLCLITGVVLVPVAVTLFLSVKPSTSSSSGAPFTLDNFVYVIQHTLTLTWLRNSLFVTLATVVVAVVVAAPAGYVLSRSKSRAVSSYSLMLFVVQSLPIITAVVPLFILFANLGLADTLVGIIVVYIGSSMSVAVWMMGAYFDTIPTSLEEAAWIDGASVFGGFLRIVLRNSLPGILSTAIFTFLLAWNDFLVALVFLKTDSTFTLPIGMQSFVQQNSTDWGSVMAVSVVMLIPPVLVFAVLNKFFSVGGIAGSLAGR